MVMLAKYKKTTGFTIVELLVVIVVIAILAAITIVAYNGVTNKAAKTTDVASIQAYISGLQQLAVTGNLPTANACLGAASTYPNATGNCPEGGQTATQSDSATLNASLKTVGVKDLAFVETTGVTPMFVYNYYGLGYYSILYAMPIDQVCGLPGVLSPQNYQANTGSWGLWGAPYSFRSGGATFCAVTFPVSN